MARHHRRTLAVQWHKQHGMGNSDERRERVKRLTNLGSPTLWQTPPTDCYFHPRCRYAIDRCRTESPQLAEISPNHFVSCHRAAELTFNGVVD